MTELDDLADARHWPALARLLDDWLPHQRWFAGKDRDVGRCAVQDTAILDGGGRNVLLVLADVELAGAPAERYQIPLVASASTEPLGTLGGLTLHDALIDAEGATVLARWSTAGSCRTERGATLVGRAVDERVPIPVDSPRPLRAEQSNSSVVFGDEAILKVFRRLEVGTNPDVELTRALTQVGFPHVPAQHGATSLVTPDGHETALAVLSEFIASGREGWDLAVTHLAGEPVLEPNELATLGEVVAALHIALRAAFGAGEADAATLDDWARGMQQRATKVLETAARVAPERCAAALARREEIAERLAAPAEQDAGGPLLRIHGDLHLGQVLRAAEGDWRLLDFEGEPMRPLAERRAPNAPLRDVAGMLRSFDYAASTAPPRTADKAAHWRASARAAFRDAYLAAAADHEVLPQPAATTVQLAAFELDKAVYELGYELANRPDWVWIPVEGICRVLDGDGAGSDET